MNYLPSPPSSPLLSSSRSTASTEEKVVICGSCDQVLGPSWFCSTCHTKCTLCNRFLTGQEHCTRCWIYDHTHQTMIRRRPLPTIPYFMMIPTPTTSSSSLKSNQSYHF
ncbi:unnamed protein product [Cunninghamella blakesleeana]